MSTTRTDRRSHTTSQAKTKLFGTGKLASFDNEALYRQRFARYTTAMRNEQPDRVPIRPFVAEFIGEHAGYTCQELVHDYENAFAATRQCASDYEWDAMVPNMLATWTGMIQAMGLRYYMTPGIDLPPDVGHQYHEPSPAEAWMKPDEYDALIEDPTGFLFNVWFPRVSKPLSPMGEAATFEHNLTLIKGPLAMTQFFQAMGVQTQRLREECGMPSAISGMLRAPMDFIADKLRGYLGLVDDLHERPEKVLAACEALMPFLTHFALATADPDRNVPIGFWMHRGCVPFINFDHFNNIYWPTLKPIVQELWANGHQTLFYAEGDWGHHLDSFAKLPERSIVYHIDKGDLDKTHKKLGNKFCLSGGISNYLLGMGSPEQVRQECKRVIETIGRDGGYIMDASAIVMRDAKVENLRAMTDATLEYGVYSQGHASTASVAHAPKPAPEDATPGHFVSIGSNGDGRRPPGVCVSWPEKKATLPPIQGDEALCRRIWQSVDSLAAMYLWWIALAF